MSSVRDVKKLRPKMVKIYKECFDVFDADSSGKIDVYEYYNKMTSLNQNIDREEFVDLLRSTDPDGEAEINIAEFMITMAKRKPNKETDEEKKAGVNAFDISENGYIARDELQETMQICNLPLTEAELEAVFKVNDKDKNNYLNPKEFIEMMNYAEKMINLEGFEGQDQD